MDVLLNTAKIVDQDLADSSAVLCYQIVVILRRLNHEEMFDYYWGHCWVQMQFLTFLVMIALAETLAFEFFNSFVCSFLLDADFHSLCGGVIHFWVKLNFTVASLLALVLFGFELDEPFKICHYCSAVDRQLTGFLII